MVAKSGEVPTLVAEPGAGQSMTQAARDALRKVDSVLTENSGALKDTIANFKVFSEGLARNTGKLDGIVAGLERMTGVTSPPPKITYDLARAAESGTGGQGHQRTMGDPGAVRRWRCWRRSVSCSRRRRIIPGSPRRCGPMRCRN